MISEEQLAADEKMVNGLLALRSHTETFKGRVLVDALSAYVAELRRVRTGLEFMARCEADPDESPQYASAIEFMARNARQLLDGTP